MQENSKFGFLSIFHSREKKERTKEGSLLISHSLMKLRNIRRIAKYGTRERELMETQEREKAQSIPVKR